MLVRNLLIHAMCPFKDAIKTTVRELAERTKITHTHSERPYTRNVLIRRRSFEPQGGEHLSAELDG